MQVNTSRFGVLTVNETEIFQFIHGFAGFSNLIEYFMVPVPESQLFTWLQAKEDPKVAFLIVSPFAFIPDYQFDLPEHNRQELGIEGPEDIIVFATVTIPAGEIKDMTANLVAPVIINSRLRRGMQLILNKTDYATKHQLFENQRHRAAGE